MNTNLYISANSVYILYIYICFFSFKISVFSKNAFIKYFSCPRASSRYHIAWGQWFQETQLACTWAPGTELRSSSLGTASSLQAELSLASGSWGLRASGGGREHVCRKMLRVSPDLSTKKRYTWSCSFCVRKLEFPGAFCETGLE